MNKNRVNHIYQTEYSSSFKWDHNSKDENHMTNNIERSSRSPVFDRKVHQFRHKLKLALLEKLDKLESEYGLNTAQMADRNFVGNPKISRQRKSHSKNVDQHPQEIKTSSEAAHHSKSRKSRKPKNKTNSGSDYDALCRELRRSRSLALEFKQKNESTQIWWLNESLCVDSDGDTPHDNFNATPVANRRPHVKKSVKTATVENDCPIRIHPRRSSFISNKISTTDPSQAYSKSSFSYQIAQATGYQSTTDELSSFNHDTDGKSVDQNNAVNCNIYSESPVNDGTKKCTELNIPKLDLPIISSDQDCPTPNSPLHFYSPYQKEDFVADTIIFDSNVDGSNPNFDTYRLD